MSDLFADRPRYRKRPKLTKKQRKARRRGFVAARRWSKWWRSQPPRWRIFARWRWKRNEPKYEWRAAHE